MELEHEERKNYNEKFANALGIATSQVDTTEQHLIISFRSTKRDEMDRMIRRIQGNYKNIDELIELITARVRGEIPNGDSGNQGRNQEGA